MATVFRAQDQVLDRTVAVKIMLPQYAGDATFAARFKQEAQAAAGLSSPYIVGVYDWGKDGDTYYIVMEYLRGTDLKSGIKSHGALDPKKVAQIGSQISSALSVAHKHEIIHRDIKPQNIMVLPDGNIKVMDFGIARAKNSHLTQDNNVLGTAHYVSPEQTRGQDLGPTSDIYSLGVVMYECATGRVPFDGDDAISVALKQVNELPIPPSQINSGRRCRPGAYHPQVHGEGPGKPLPDGRRAAPGAQQLPVRPCRQRLGAHAHHRCRRRPGCHQDPRAFRLNARYGSSRLGRERSEHHP